MSGPPVDVPAFDPSAIEKIRQVAGPDAAKFIAELAQLSLDEGSKSIAAMRVASEADDWRAVSRICHSLKSSSATLGLMLLSDACKELEQDTKRGSAGEDTQPLLSEVFGQFEQAVPLLKALL